VLSPGPAPTTTARLLDEVVLELTAISRRTGLERVLAIGELILNRFFAGDPVAWRDRRRNKQSSIRRLAGRTDCPFSRSTLNEAVSVYLAVNELPSVRMFGHIGAAHVAAVLALPPCERLPMLERADQERWAVRELRDQVVRVRRGRGERRGRPAARCEDRHLAVLDASLQRSSQAVRALGELGAMDQAAHAAVQELARAFAELSVRLDQLGKWREEGHA
jgi:hypothetical protein